MEDKEFRHLYLDDLIPYQPDGYMQLLDMIQQKDPHLPPVIKQDTPTLLKEWLASSIALEATSYIQSWVAQMVETNHSTQATQSLPQDEIISSSLEAGREVGGMRRHFGADVPRPISQTGNAVLMEYIGDVNEPAPMLKEVTVTTEEAQALFDCVMRNIELCLAHDRIHGDLSEYNILCWRGAVTLIDFAQAVDPHQNPGVFSLLLRDIERVCRYFARYGIAADAVELATDLWTRYQGLPV